LPTSPSTSTVTVPPRGTPAVAISNMLSSSLALFLGSSMGVTFHSRSAFSPAISRLATRSASRVSISVPAVEDAPKASRANSSLARAWRVEFSISSLAKPCMSTCEGSARTSSPLPMAPTGLIRSWQTREHSNAARSAASSSTMLIMAFSPFVGSNQFAALYSALWEEQRQPHGRVALALLQRGGAVFGQQVPIGRRIGQRVGGGHVEGGAVAD